MSVRKAAMIAVVVLLAAPAPAPAPALAVGPHLTLVSAYVLGTIGGALGSVFGTIGHAVLGAFG